MQVNVYNSDSKIFHSYNLSMNLQILWIHEAHNKMKKTDSVVLKEGKESGDHLQRSWCLRRSGKR